LEFFKLFKNTATGDAATFATYQIQTACCFQLGLLVHIQVIAVVN